MMFRLAEVLATSEEKIDHTSGIRSYKVHRCVMCLEHPKIPG